VTPAFRAPSFYEGDETKVKSDDGVPAPQRTGAISHVCFSSPGHEIPSPSRNSAWMADITITISSVASASHAEYFIEALWKVVT
jgi:hypothetical protein